MQLPPHPQSIPYKQEVAGSSPALPTNFSNKYAPLKQAHRSEVRLFAGRGRHLDHLKKGALASQDCPTLRS
jgi:hypothetical protein